MFAHLASSARSSINVIRHNVGRCAHTVTHCAIAAHAVYLVLLAHDLHGALSVAESAVVLVTLCEHIRGEA